MSKPSDRRQFLYLAMAASASLPWMALRLAGVHPPHPWDAVLTGLCTLGAAVLLTWAAEAAEMDMPQNISIGILALVAVMPEYAVDLYFAWAAGKNPSYAAFATANMTGANRLLIGAGWPAVLLACWISQGKRYIQLRPAQAVEVVALLAATVYSLILPLKASLSLWDSLFLFLVYLFYVILASRTEAAEPELTGPSELIARLPKTRRRLAIGGLFLFSAAAILLSAAPFAEGLLAIGRHFRIEEFVLVQWLAPLASEAPEFAAAIIFALKGKPEAGLKTLVASKVNQWTLLIGALPVAYCLSSKSFLPLPLDPRQAEEILLTSSQSMLALILLMNLRLDLHEAGLLIALFATQVFFPQAEVRYAFAAIYLTLACFLFLTQSDRRENIRRLLAQVLTF